MSLLPRMIGIAGVAGLAGAAAWAVLAPAREVEGSKELGEGVAAAMFAPLPAVDAQAPNLITEMSPFANDRSPFDRASASAPLPPPVEMKLTGIFRVGKELRASLVVNGQSIVVRKGDETAAGKVTKIELDSIVISGASELKFEMFK